MKEGKKPIQRLACGIIGGAKSCAEVTEIARLAGKSINMVCREAWGGLPRAAAGSRRSPQPGRAAGLASPPRAPLPCRGSRRRLRLAAPVLGLGLAGRPPSREV